MLLAFRVTNHKSVRDEAELSLVRSTRLTSRSGGDKAPSGLPSPVAAIYGANASGKSNLLDALAFMARAVSDSYGRWPVEGPIPLTPFALGKEHRQGPSAYEVELLLDGIRYQYGFSLDRERVIEEWLYAYPRKRQQVWFERDEEFRFGTLLTGQKQVLAELTRSNALFLSVAGSTGHDQLTPVFSWFQSGLNHARPANEAGRLRRALTRIALSPHITQQALDILRFADLGISGVTVEAAGGVQPTLFEGDEAQLGWLTDLTEEPDDVTLAEAPRKAVAGTRYRAKRGRYGPDLTVMLEHTTGDGEAVALQFESESRGTQALLALAVPALDVLNKGVVLLVDELDASMHPKLVREVVRLFQSQGTNPRHAQLIFTCHDTSLLSDLAGEDPLLERDQVWFSEKGPDGATVLYPLTDFSPRREENLERGYLQGRYGAVPVLRPDTLDDLLAEGQ